MRRTLAGSTIISIILVLLTTGSQAEKEQQQQQWCAYFTGGPTNCGFATFAQCLQAIRGKTGLCEQNAEYTAPAARSTNGHRDRSHGH